MSNSLLKAESRVAAITAVGEEIEKLLVAAEQEIEAKRTAKRELAMAGQRINEMARGVIEKELENGALTLEQADLVRRWLVRAVGICDNLATTREAESIAAVGKVAGLKLAVERLGKARDRDVSFMKAAVASIEEPPADNSKVVDIRRPPPGLAQRRKMEEMAAALNAPESSPESEQNSAPESEQTSGDSEPSKISRRRRRPPSTVEAQSE